MNRIHIASLGLRWRRRRGIARLAALVALAVGCPAAWGVPIPTGGVWVDVEAHYRFAHDTPATASAASGAVQSTAQALPAGQSTAVDPGLLPPVLNAAVATGRAEMLGVLDNIGSVGAYANAGGNDATIAGTLAPPIRADTVARQVTRWKANTLGNQNATINVHARYDGVLLLYDFLGLGVHEDIGDLWSSVNARLSLHTVNLGRQDFNRVDATLDEVAGLQVAPDALDDAWRFAAILLRDNQKHYSVTLDHVYQIQVPTNLPFAIESVLSTSAFARNDREIWALSDFLNSGGFTLSAVDPDVTLEALVDEVPAPATLALSLAPLCMVGVLRRRRRAVFRERFGALSHRETALLQLLGASPRGS